MILEVRALDGAYRVECAEVLALDLTECAFAGATINVFVDRADPKTVVVDIDDLRRKAAEKVTQAAEKHAQLLRGG